MKVVRLSAIRTGRVYRGGGGGARGRGGGVAPSKRGRCVWLTTLPPSGAECLEIWEPQLPGALRACPGLYRDSFIWLQPLQLNGEQEILGVFENSEKYSCSLASMEEMCMKNVSSNISH
jgi:hypothetical protein